MRSVLLFLAVAAVAALCVAAPSGEDNESTSNSQEAEESCEPGRNYPSPDNCNTCICTSTRVLACTRRACVNFQPPN